jgi:hypothetical protein
MSPDDALPPELKSVSKQEFREAYEAAMHLAMGLTRGNKAQADELVSDTFEALMTTRRWDPTRGPLVRHVLGALTSIRSNKFRSKGGDRDKGAEKAYQRDELGLRGADAQERMLEHNEREGARQEAAEVLDELEKSLADHAVAPRVLRARREADDGDKKKAAEIAAMLKMPVDPVYGANKLLREHAAKILARRRGGRGERDEET